MGEILDAFENWSGRTVILRVALIAKKPLFDFVISITCSVLIRSF